jgi:hypothetical protein
VEKDLEGACPAGDVMGFVAEDLAAVA